MNDYIKQKRMYWFTHILFCGSSTLRNRLDSSLSMRTIFVYVSLKVVLERQEPQGSALWKCH